jgi:arylsulfatase A-like enzyme
MAVNNHAMKELRANRWNILFISSDQQAPDFLGRHSDFFTTPHLDRLAGEGVALERSYTCCPVCTPSRATWITGQYPSRHGAWSIGTNLDSGARTLPAILGENGYQTAIFGKSHLQSCLTPGTLESQPHVLDTSYFRKWSGPWYGFDHAKINVGHTNEPHSASMHYRAWLEDRGVNLDKYFSPNLKFFGGSSNIHEMHWSIPEEVHPMSWIAEEADRFIRQQHQEHPEKPFFACVNFPDPHGPDVVPSPYFERYAEREVNFRPKRQFGEWEGKPRLYQAALKDSLMELGWHDRAGIPCMSCEGVATTEENAREFTMIEKNRLRVKAAMMEMLDAKVGCLLRTLEELGIADNTLVFFTSDHGEYAGAHYLWSKGGAHYGEAIRVPTIVRLPAAMRSPGVSQALFSNVDIAPTFLDLVGLPIPKTMQGVSQLETWQDPSRHVRESVLIDFRAERGLYVNSLVTSRYRLSLHSVEDGTHDLEFYDLERDPAEFHNVADLPEHAPRIRKMLASLIYQRSESSCAWQERLAFA